MASSSSSSLSVKYIDSAQQIPQPLLPQHGAPARPTPNSFATLVSAHPFLFRVHTPHARQGHRSPSPTHSRYGSRTPSRAGSRPASRAASPPPSRSMSMQRVPTRAGSTLSRHSSYLSSSFTSAIDDLDSSGGADEPFFLSPRSKDLRDAAYDIVSGSSDWDSRRPGRRERTLSGMSGMSGYSDATNTAGGLSDSWTSAGGETAVDEDAAGGLEQGGNEKEDVVTKLGLTRSISSAVIISQPPAKVNRRMTSFDSRPLDASYDASSLDSSIAGYSHLESSQRITEKPSLSSLLAHLDPGTRPSSTYVSASMSFFYALWEAVRRYKVNVKHDVEIAIIDGRAFLGEDDDEGDSPHNQRVWTVSEMMHLRDSDDEGRALDIYDSAIVKPISHLVTSQTALVQGSISSSSVFSSLQLRDVLPALPNYLFKHDFFAKGAETQDQRVFGSMLLENLVWDAYTSSATPNKKTHTTFRQFCGVATKSFLTDERSHGDRVRDATTGAVGLAGVLVGKWAKGRIKETLLDDLQRRDAEDEDPFADPITPEMRKKQHQERLNEARSEVTQTLTHLTLLIAAWPSRAWFETHLAEIKGLIEDVVRMYVSGIVEAAEGELSREAEEGEADLGDDERDQDERRGRDDTRRRARSPPPYPSAAALGTTGKRRRAFSISRTSSAPPTHSRITPPHTPPSTLSRGGSANLGDSPSSVASGQSGSSSVGRAARLGGVGRSLSFGGSGVGSGGSIDGGQSVSQHEGGDSASALSAGGGSGLLPSAELVAPRPQHYTRSTTDTSIHPSALLSSSARPPTPSFGSSVHFANAPSPSSSPAKRQSSIDSNKGRKSPAPPAPPPPRRSSLRAASPSPRSSVHLSPSANNESVPMAAFPSMSPSPTPDSKLKRMSSASSVTSSSSLAVPLSNSHPGTSDNASDKGTPKSSRLTWPRSLKRVGSAPGKWPSKENLKRNGSSDSVSVPSEQGGALPAAGAEFPSKEKEEKEKSKGGLFGKPRQRTVTLMRATTGSKKEREAAKALRATEGVDAGNGNEEFVEKRKRRISLPGLGVGLGGSAGASTVSKLEPERHHTHQQEHGHGLGHRLGELLRITSKKDKDKGKGKVGLSAGLIAAGALATGVISAKSNPATESTGSLSVAKPKAEEDKMTASRAKAEEVAVDMADSKSSEDLPTKEKSSESLETSNIPLEPSVSPTLEDSHAQNAPPISSLDGASPFPTDSHSSPSTSDPRIDTDAEREHRRDRRSSGGSHSSEGSEAERERRANLSPVREVDGEVEGERTEDATAVVESGEANAELEAEPQSSQEHASAPPEGSGVACENAPEALMNVYTELEGTDGREAWEDKDTFPLSPVQEDDGEGEVDIGSAVEGEGPQSVLKRAAQDETDSFDRQSVDAVALAGIAVDDLDIFGLRDKDRLETPAEPNDVHPVANLHASPSEFVIDDNEQSVAAELEERVVTPTGRADTDSNIVPEFGFDGQADEPTVMLDPDTESTGHEYGRSLEAIDESAEELTRDSEVPQIMVDVLDGEIVLDGNSAADERSLNNEFQSNGGDMTVLVDVNLEKETSGVEDAPTSNALQFIKDDFIPPQAFVTLVDGPGLVDDEVPSENKDYPSNTNSELRPADIPLPVSVSATPQTQTPRIVPAVMLGLSPSLRHGKPLTVPVDDSFAVDDTEPGLELAVLEMLRGGCDVVDVEGIDDAEELDDARGEDQEYALSETVFSGGHSEFPSDDDEETVFASSSSLRSGSGPGVELKSLQKRHRPSAVVAKEIIPSFLTRGTPLSRDKPRTRDHGSHEELSFVRASSWAMSCFVCGVLVTLFVVSSQRRDLLSGNRFN